MAVARAGCLESKKVRRTHMESDLAWEVRVQAGKKDVPIEGQPGMGPQLR